MTNWLELRDLDLHHSELMAQYGGLPGSPNANGLAATLARPRRLLAIEPESTVFDSAAAYGFGFARNHVFPDGNKRVALAAMDVFLLLNGYDLVSDEAEAVVTVNLVAAGEISQEELSEWLEQHSTPLGDEI